MMKDSYQESLDNFYVELKEDELKIVGGIMGVISTIIGVVIAFLIAVSMRDYDWQSTLSLINVWPFKIAIISSLCTSIYIGQWAAKRIVLHKANFATLWMISGYLNLWLSILVGVISESILKSFEMTNDIRFFETFLFFFFFMTIFAFIPIIIVGGGMGDLVKIQFKIKT